MALRVAGERKRVTGQLTDELELERGKTTNHGPDVGLM